jgi:two-component system KDP operon response regulator KdpE
LEDSKLIRVLVFSIDQMTMEGLRQALRTNIFLIDEARSYKETLQFAHQYHPDVVVLDLLTPCPEDQHICTRLREFSRAPILVLSALSSPEIVAKALDQGADDYLQKPVPGSIIIAHLKKLVRRARGEWASSNSPLELR